MKSTLYHRIFMLTLCLSLILLSACSQDVEVSDESSSLASESVNASVPEVVTISGNELFTKEVYTYGNYILFGEYAGSRVYYVDDAKIVEDLANALKACTYTLVEEDTEEYKKYTTGDYFFSPSRYYDIFIFETVILHKNGDLIQVYQDGKNKIYKVSGLDKEAYDAFINYGLDGHIFG